MFYTTEIESELSEGVHLIKDVTFLKSDHDRDFLMLKIEESRFFSPYYHDQLPTCQDKDVLVLLCTCHSDYIPLFLGCGQCWSIDGNWKLGFTHCMCPVTTKLEGLQ